MVKTKVKGKRAPEAGKKPWLVPAAVVGLIVVLAVLVVAFRPPSTTTVTTPTEGMQVAKLGDHWHTSMEVAICGERQPNLPFFAGSFHSHADGVIHYHPETQRDEGPQNNLAKFLSGAGGVLTNTSLRYPGAIVGGAPMDRLLRNGDPCPDGHPGQIRVSVNGEVHPLGVSYIPQNGVRVRIEFN